MGCSVCRAAHQAVAWSLQPLFHVLLMCGNALYPPKGSRGSMDMLIQISINTNFRLHIVVVSFVLLGIYATSLFHEEIWKHFYTVRFQVPP